MNQKQFIESGNYLIDEVKRRAEKGSPHFFDANNMRFFSSRVSELAWKKDEIIYFITSEANRGCSKRLWTVRKCDIDGDITTLGEFQGYRNLSQARKAIKEEID